MMNCSWLIPPFQPPPQFFTHTAVWHTMSFRHPLLQLFFSYVLYRFHFHEWVYTENNFLTLTNTHPFPSTQFQTTFHRQSLDVPDVFCVTLYLHSTQYTHSANEPESFVNVHSMILVLQNQCQFLVKTHQLHNCQKGCEYNTETRISYFVSY